MVNMEMGKIEIVNHPLGGFRKEMFDISCVNLISSRSGIWLWIHFRPFGILTIREITAIHHHSRSIW